ncbi:hypothetical protein [Priestia megaterium]|uniref:hypothetical protein n=1 Tax=Priestia megaterium TaxID=1404 RepID=UPI000A7BC0A3|nr:hypothetical protein [Priestia megaterium]MBY0201392.1 hypothetical protein [Priestia megaterium]
MNNIINLYEFRRNRKIKKFRRIGVLVAIITISCMFAYILIVAEIHHPTRLPSYIEPKP